MTLAVVNTVIMPQSNLIEDAVHYHLNVVLYSLMRLNLLSL